MDTQVIELLGRSRLVSELLRAGLEIAVPARDRGVDLIAYVDLESDVESLIARPIQMKAASSAQFSISKKYARVRDLVLAFVWYLEDPTRAATYALTYPEAIAIGDKMGWTKTASWLEQGGYGTTRLSRGLQNLLAPYKMNPSSWRTKVMGEPSRARCAESKGVRRHSARKQRGA